MGADNFLSLAEGTRRRNKIGHGFGNVLRQATDPGIRFLCNKIVRQGTKIGNLLRYGSESLY